MLKLKKLLALVLSVATMFAVNVTAFAAEKDVQSVSSAIVSSNGEVLAGLRPVGLTRSASYEVTADNVRLRKEPSLSSTVLGLLYEGDIVTMGHGEEDYVDADGYTWAYVHSNRHGWWGWVAVNYIEEIG